MEYSSPLDFLADHSCELCPLSETTERVCVMGKGDPASRVMLVGEAPGREEERSGKVFSGAAGQLLDKCLERAGLSPSELYITNAVKCRPPDNRTPERIEAKICASEYLTAEIEEVRPTHILLLGNAALQAVARKSGITKHRGVRLEIKGHPKSRTIMAAFHPAYALRNPGVHPTLQEDIRRFARAIKGEFQVVPVAKKYVGTVDGLRKVIALLESAPPGSVVSYDVENRYRPWDKDWSIQCLGVSLDGHTSYVIPLYHPDSPFGKKWKSVLAHLRHALIRPDIKLVAQNGKHDNVQLAGAGIFLEHRFDVMLAAHLLDENRPKNLGFLSQTYLGADVYKGGLDLKPEQILKVPIKDLCAYNGEDVGYTHQLYQKLRPELIEHPRLTRLFTKLMMPGSHVIQQVEMKGMHVDQERLFDRIGILQGEIKERKLEMQDHVSTKMLKHFPGGEFNYRSPIQVSRLLYSSEKRGGLGLSPVMWTKTGNGSTNEESLQNYIDHPFVQLLFELRTLELKWMNTYLLPWSTKLDRHSRLHTTYKLYGTVTGRLSGDLQQVPRDSFVRSVFGAPAGWVRLDADFSQIELRIAAHVAGERSMRRSFLTGEDIHTKQAANVTGKPISVVGKEERKLAKAVNFGYLYGMYPAKFQKYAKINYGVDVSMAEAEVSREKYFAMFPDLLKWHERQRRMVHLHQHVHSPLGRVRHLPDVLSPDNSVRMEAERQAINSPVQSTASDLTLFAMIQIQKFMRSSEAAMVMTLHDGIGFEIREDKVEEYAVKIKETMENLPIQRTFGARLSVPIIAEVEWGSHWAGTDDASGLGFTGYA
ncbi:MAG TPA: DNA polymerase [Ktedonobacteraceae bacterium]